MISKSEFEESFRDFLDRYELSLSQASVILTISRLRVYLYLTGWFRYDEKRESEVIQKMASYILLQKLRSTWLERRSKGVRKCTKLYQRTISTS
jgi:hypothetical protein